MVPGSTLMYGSIFWIETRKPRLSRRSPTHAEVSPLPRLETTPPVTKMCLAMLQPPADHELSVLVGRVDPVRVRHGRSHGDAVACLEDPELLEHLRLLERRRRKRGDLREEVLAIRVHPEVLPPSLGRAGARAVEGKPRSREVDRTPVR